MHPEPFATVFVLAIVTFIQGDGLPCVSGGVSTQFGCCYEVVRMHPDTVTQLRRTRATVRLTGRMHGRVAITHVTIQNWSGAGALVCRTI